MARTTIDYGIDLGTTNSAIALLSGVDTEVIPNERGALITPSAVWIDKRGRMRIGQEAKERYELDKANVALEFKLNMGLGQAGARTFADANRSMLPEELSAEVLKALRGHVQVVKGEEIRAAVITVPANFGTPQVAATRRAAELAGFAESPLLQEPVAAALAYGFQRLDDAKEHWLVYDFGGGTFDAAVIKSSDGWIEVVHNSGDNRLGGKLIDWDIVEQIFAPHIARKHSLRDFHHGNRRWELVFAKLKYAAEQAKIDVSRTNKQVEVWSENVGQDDSGRPFDLEYTLTPEEVARLTSPYVARSLNLCREALQAKKLEGHVAKVIMVGGSSLFPWLREEVKQALGVPLDGSIDPMTVVARGAAIFAGTQRVTGAAQAPAPAGTFKLQLEYDPVGNDEEPEIAGRVHHPQGASLKGFTLQFREQKSQWNSGRIRLGDNGAFETTLHAEKKRRNLFSMELRDAAGTLLPIAPDSFPYTIGAEFDGQPLSHTIGVAMANEHVDSFVRQNTTLPTSKRKIHRTAHAYARGSKEPIKIPIVEGEHELRADRNRWVGNLEIPTSEIRRDLPAGSEVEITLNIDASRIITVEAYFPILDQTFEAKLNMDAKQSSASELRSAIDRENRRLSDLRDRASRFRDDYAQKALAEIDREQILDQIERFYAAGNVDPSALVEAEERLRALKVKIDAVEDALQWPVLQQEAEDKLEECKRTVNAHGDQRDRLRLQSLEADLRKALAGRQIDRVKQLVSEVSSLSIQVDARRPEFWMGVFSHLEEREGLMRDRAQASQLLSVGRRAINSNDVEGLKAVCRQLIGLLPADEAAKSGLGGSTQAG